MNKGLILTICLTFLFFKPAWQQDRLDSLENVLETVTKEEKFTLLTDLVLENLNISLNKSIEYAIKSIVVANELNDSLKIGEAHDYLAIAHYYSGNLEQALNNWQITLSIYKNHGDNKAIAQTLNNIGVIYSSLGEYQKAIGYYQENLRIQQKTGDSLNIARSLNNIGNIYFEFGIDYEKALEYYQQGLVMFEKLEDDPAIAQSHNNIGLVYKELKSYSLALENFRDALKIYKRLDDNTGIAFTQNNMGSVYLVGGNYEMALQYSLNAMTAYRQQGKNADLALSIRDIGNVYFKWGKYDKALEYFNRSIDLFMEMNMKKEILDTYKMISDVYSNMDNYEKAFATFKKYAELKDSTLGEDYLKQIQELEAKYESDKKEQQIMLHEAELEKKAVENKRQKLVIYSFVLGLFLVLIFSLLLYKQFREKKKANLLLEKQNHEISNQRDQIFQQKMEITDSIHYASKIQSAVLPPDDYIKENFPDHFILYKPRDIVSGDFYWLTQQNGRVIYCAADCTGHGVPGAFMSMLGVAFLNEIVSKGHDISAAMILNELRKYIVQSLHQEGKEGEAKDGMDIALCIVDKENMKLQFAGAFNPLIKVRNNEIIEIRGDRMPIGIHINMKDDFTNHEIDIQKNDAFYIYSDGYVDQFGGDKGKKFMSKRFKQLLIEINKFSMQEQKQILENRLKEWMGQYEQVDDIIVIGARV
ncbi:MAG: tetratricopeptide repeat protein [Bacteroidales bacterium]